MNERNLKEGQREDRKQWSLGVGQRRKTLWNRYIYIYIYIYIVFRKRYQLRVFIEKESEITARRGNL
jgi:hypothetical protein